MRRLSESVPGRMLYDADVEAYLKESAAIDSQETAVYLCKIEALFCPTGADAQLQHFCRENDSR